MLTNRSLLLIVAVSFCCHLATVVLSLANASQPILYQLVEKSSAGIFIANVFEDSGLDTFYSNPADRINLRLSFRTPGPSYLIYFTLNDTTGILRTSANLLDRDRLCAYQNSCILSLEVQVLPSNYFQLFTVAVNILDINDHTPTFTPNFIRLNISESDAPQRVYPLPPVDDPDGGSNGIQSFHLEPNSTKFQLNVGFLADGSTDVQLRLMEYLERSKVGFYSLTLLAVDGGTPQRTGSLVINVTVVDSVSQAQSLGFDKSNYEVTVAESLAIGSVVLRVKASYQGTGASNPHPEQILYGFDPGTQRSQIFGINSVTGDIYLNGSLDFRNSRVFLLTVSAVARTRPTTTTSMGAYARVTVYVNDSNNNAPAVKVTTFTADGIAEVNDSASVGSFVAYLGISDADDGLNAEVNCVINSTTFRLDPVYKDYLLKTGVKFTRGHSTQYAVAVTCTDRGSPPRSTAVVVLVRVSSPGPVFSSDRILVDFYENNGIGDTIVALNVTYDAPPDSKLTFDHSPLEDSPQSAISVNSTSGVVTANVIFKHDVRRQFSYVVTVSDLSKPPTTTTATTASATLVINILPLPIPTGNSVRPPSLSSPSSSSGFQVTLTVGQDAAGPPLLKESSTVIITAVVCATVIVVVIIVVVAVIVVCYRRNQQKTLAAAASAARLAKAESMSSDGTKRLVRSVSSVSSSVASTSGESRGEIRLGSIQEESFEDTFHQMTPAEWPTIDRQTSYPDSGMVGATGLDSSFRSQTKRGLYARSVSHPGNQNRAARASRSYGEDGSDTSRVTDTESASYCSGSMTDSGRGNSLQEDGAAASSSTAAAAAGSVSPRSNESQEVFRTESNCSGSSGRPLVAITTRCPMENKIYITNHFRDALPRHPLRFARADRKDSAANVSVTEARKDPVVDSRKLESNRSGYFDARSRASHYAAGQEPSNRVGSRSPERVTLSPASPKGHESRAGEFTRSLYIGHENGAFRHSSPMRQVSPPGEVHRTKDAGVENHVRDTFV